MNIPSTLAVYSQLRHHRCMNYAKQWIDKSDVAAVTAALKESQITRGKRVDEFEQAVADLYSAKYAIAFNSGTSAMSAAYRAADVGPYDQIITSANTYIGTITGALQLGAKIQLCDIDPNTGHMIPEPLPKPSRGRLVYVPVHFAGVPVKPFPITDPNALVIEDAAHAFGAKGILKTSAMALFSFHPAKTITTGEGGMILTNEEHYASHLRTLRNNGEWKELSGNYHMTDLQAALGLSQLKRLDQILEKRKQLIEIYQKELKILDHPSGSAYNLAVTFIPKKRDAVRKKLAEQAIGTQIHYKPLYHHPALKTKSLPNMEKYFQEALTLPLYYELTEEEVKTISQATLSALSKSGS